MTRFIRGIIMVMAMLVLPSSIIAADGPHPDRGLYAIWTFGDTEVEKLPYITGGQIILQWQELNPEPGRFDFAPLDTLMQEMYERNRKTTVQINGRKPAWLFEKVPHHPERLAPQVGERQGSLMYWHPVYMQAYIDLLHAWAGHMRQSPYRSVVLGIRQSFNALGTEHHLIPEDKRSPDQWVTPPGVAPGPEWTEDIGQNYNREILTAFIKNFSPDFTIFVRNHIRDELRAPFRHLWENGTLAWFHTSSEMEPRSAGTERQYQTFIEYCRSGQTTGYAESWADAWGWHGRPEPDPRWCSPPQWNYWRLLGDLHCGASFIALYGADLRVALDGKHPHPWSRVVDEKQYPEYISEFEQAFRFTARYVGYAAHPAESPGAWIAFRHSTVNLQFNRPIQSLTGDYSFHMRRLNEAGNIERTIGPDDQRYGAWALKLPVSEEVRIAVDEKFLGSLQHQAAVMNVVYLDRGTGMLELSLGREQRRQKLADSGVWKTASFPVKQRPLKGEGIVTLRCTGGPVYLHMVELVRGE